MRAVCRPAVLAIPAVAVVLTWGGGREAEAGAWTREAGSLQLIAKVGRQQRPVRSSIETDDPSPSNIAQLYSEYGLRDGLTVGGSFWLDIAPDDLSQGSASVGAFARRRVWQRDDGRVASVQIGVSVPAEQFIADEFAEDKPFSTLDIGIDGLFGKSWWGDWGNAFLSTGAGYHLRFEDQPPELRGEATGGIELHPCCLTMLSVYGLEPLGEGASESALVVSPSFGWHVARGSGEDPGRRTTLQLGATYDPLNTDSGFGVFLGIWQSF